LRIYLLIVVVCLASVHLDAQFVSSSKNNMQNTNLSFSDSAVLPITPVGKYTTKNFFKEKDSTYRFLRLSRANVTYMYDYRSAIDTPYAEKNIGQHQFISQFSLLFSRSIPVNGYVLVRKSNSVLFKDIFDVQLQFDAASYRSGLSDRLRQNLSRSVELLKDSLSGKLCRLKEQELSKLTEMFDRYSMQKLVEANELINIPESTYDLSLSDSVNQQRYDSLKSAAQLFLDQYNALRDKYGDVKQQADSLRQIFETSVQQVKELQQLIREEPLSDGASYRSLQRKLNVFLPSLPGNNSWLMNIKALSVGRNPLSSSELTAKNISQTGVSFVYNSWYYFAVSAGLIDYRFRDFAVKRRPITPQHLYLVRAGLGNTEKSYMILSFFQGQKQLFASSATAAGSKTINITGVSAEGKWQIGRHSYFLTEVAQSFAPALQQPASTGKNAGDENKAVYAKFYTSIPKTGSRIEAHYKYTGANYQAFNSFQTNASLKVWSVKADQQLFGRKLRLVASLSSNDFQNPFIGYYQSNTVFKTLTATWRSKRFPVISVGYMPMSQMTIVENYVQESRFQTFTTTVSHFYRLGEARAATNFFYTKFFNESQDSGFVYYNANNLFAGQSIFFKKLTINVSVSTTKNADYSYTVFDESIDLPVSGRISVGAGVKINRMNSKLIRTGGYMNGDIYLFNRDLLSFRIEQSYLPTGKGGLMPTVMGSIQFSKTIR
jgi:hypothetical protein